MHTSTDELPDPTTVRLSEHFLLSDFIGNDSIYRHGLANIFKPGGGHYEEGKALCTHVLEPLLEWSRLSVSYGFISPAVSNRIVKYQDPTKPSYHRWDCGAACDVVLHDRQAINEAPIFSAFWIDDHLPTSRIITYSESPFLCVATRAAEIAQGKPRKALYENRYVGVVKPCYVPYSQSMAVRRQQKQEVKLEHDWRGAFGYPRYHGGGREQFQHTRTSEFTVLTDWLYSREATEDGHKNRPETQRSILKFRRAGAVYDAILKSLSIRRMSIVRGYESPTWIGSRHNWDKDVCFVVVPPAGVDPRSVAAAAKKVYGVTEVRLGESRRVAIAASFR